MFFIIDDNRKIFSDCPPNMILRGTECVVISSIVPCPERFYLYSSDSSSNNVHRLNPLAEDLTTEKIVNNNNNRCIPCHYSCKNCVGSIDYECSECYPDATLVTVSNNESYCYPNYLASVVGYKSWYVRIFIMLCVIFVIMTIHLFWYVFKKRTGINKKNYVQLDTIENIRNMERNVKMAVYSDSDE